MEISARVSGAASLLVVHADGDESVKVSVVCRGGRGQALRRWVREAAVGLGTLAGAALELAADLQWRSNGSEGWREKERERGRVGEAAEGWGRAGSGRGGESRIRRRNDRATSIFFPKKN